MPSSHGCPSKRPWALLVATCCGLGYRTRWPGTLTSAITTAVLFTAHSIVEGIGESYASPAIAVIITASLPVLLLFLFILGTWASHILLATERATESHADPPHIVIDEVVGQALTLWLTQSQSLYDYGVCFILFRFFDIVKPPPIRQLEHMGPQALALMHDDVAAAVMAAGVFLLVPLLFASLF
ncbi:MAG: phosphatidylglycerophosphatase A [Alphaproteobacteria bacterium GM7ARS4]|nr:phosphatidylglycerophosphatase A [Alphaproteobacteria bacterium GM7ARS4]